MIPKRGPHENSEKKSFYQAAKVITTPRGLAISPVALRMARSMLKRVVCQKQQVYR